MPRYETLYPLVLRTSSIKLYHQAGTESHHNHSETQRFKYVKSSQPRGTIKPPDEDAHVGDLGLEGGLKFRP